MRASTLLLMIHARNIALHLLLLSLVSTRKPTIDEPRGRPITRDLSEQGRSAGEESQGWDHLGAHVPRGMH